MKVVQVVLAVSVSLLLLLVSFVPAEEDSSFSRVGASVLLRCLTEGKAIDGSGSSSQKISSSFCDAIRIKNDLSHPSMTAAKSSSPLKKPMKPRLQNTNLP